MKVFVIQSGTYTPNGQKHYSITSRRQVESLRKNGIEVKVGLVTIRTSPKGIKENIKRLKKEVTAFQPDVIHSHYGAMVSWVAFQVTQKIYPLVVSFCGDDLLGTPNKGLVWRVRENISKQLSFYVAKKAKFIIVKSQNLLTALPRKTKEKASVIPNGIDASFFKPHQEKTRIREELGWSDDEFIIFFNSSETTNKAVKNPKLAYESLEELQKLGVHAKIEEVSKLLPAEFQKRMAASDCLLVTSLHEGSPNIIKEAMACNLPVVTVNCGDVKVRLKNVNIGGIYNYDAEMLGEAMYEVYFSQKEYNGRGEFFKQKLSDKNIANEIINTYRSAVLNTEI